MGINSGSFSNNIIFRILLNENSLVNTKDLLNSNSVWKFVKITKNKVKIAILVPRHLCINFEIYILW